MRNVSLMLLPFKSERNINALTSRFQVLKNPFKIFYSVKNSAEARKKVEKSLVWNAGINEVRLMGKLGKDPWLDTIQGKPTLHLLIGIPQTCSKKDDAEPNWQVVYTQNRSLIKSLQTYMKKGMRVYFTAQLSYLKNDKCSDKSVNVKIINYLCI